mmetsp:Transcript_117965/g.334538  ORF Transcript_117965/g.334538 Transcript_117965/m.334538 type:complete len:247 (-) Transcript_117965:412-1152(-)
MATTVGAMCQRQATPGYRGGRAFLPNPARSRARAPHSRARLPSPRTSLSRAGRRRWPRPLMRLCRCHPPGRWLPAPPCEGRGGAGTPATARRAPCARSRSGSPCRSPAAPPCRPASPRRSSRCRRARSPGARRTSRRRRPSWHRSRSGRRGPPRVPRRRSRGAPSSTRTERRRPAPPRNRQPLGGGGWRGWRSRQPFAEQVRRSSGRRCPAGRSAWRRRSRTSPPRRGSAGAGRPPRPASRSAPPA